jgi:hypothetical protein
MIEPLEKVCPFDKNPCIGAECAIWSEDSRVCALALIPQLIPRQASGTVKPVRRKETPSSSGISGKFRDPLFE